MKVFFFSLFIFYQSLFCFSRDYALFTLANRSTCFYKSCSTQVCSPTSFGLDLCYGSRTQLNQYLSWGDSISLGFKGGEFAPNIIAPFAQLNVEIFCNYWPDACKYFGIKLGAGGIYDNTHCYAPLPFPFGAILQASLILLGNKIEIKRDYDGDQNHVYSKRAKRLGYKSGQIEFYQMGISLNAIESSSKFSIFFEYGW